MNYLKFDLSFRNLLIFVLFGIKIIGNLKKLKPRRTGQIMFHIVNIYFR